jgi:hypothetical protein
MRNIKEIEQIFENMLPWVHKSTDVVAILSSVREGAGNFMIINVKFYKSGEVEPLETGYVKYNYWPDCDTMEAISFNSGPQQGMLLLKDYHDYSCQFFLDNGFNGKTKALDPRVMEVYEDFGWEKSSEHSNIWIIKPENKNAN